MCIRAWAIFSVRGCGQGLDHSRESMHEATQRGAREQGQEVARSPDCRRLVCAGRAQGVEHFPPEQKRPSWMVHTTDAHQARDHAVPGLLRCGSTTMGSSACMCVANLPKVLRMAADKSPALTQYLLDGSERQPLQPVLYHNDASLR